MKPKTYHQLRVDEEAAKIEAQKNILLSLSKIAIASDPGDEVEPSYIFQWG